MPSVSTVISASGELIAAPTAGFIRVIGYQITSAGNPGRIDLKSGTAVKATVLSFSSNGGGQVSNPISGNSEPYFDCADRTALNAAVTTAVDTAFNIQYVIKGF